MNHLIQSVTLPGAGNIPLSGLILVVGPNSSGKTRFLRDLRSAGSKKSSFVVCSDIEVQKLQDLQGLMKLLSERGLIEIKNPDSPEAQVLGATSHVGTIGPLQIPSISLKQLTDANAKWETRGENENPVVSFFGPILTSFLFLENRLLLTADAKSFDHSNQRPQNELQELHVKDKAQDELHREIGRAFGKGIAIDFSRANTLTLRIVEKWTKPTPTMRPAESKGRRTVSEEGDGLRSYVAICMTLLIGFRPLTVIDEPEFCLHPPQAYSIGQFIGKHAVDNGQTTVVATHSSHVLRGMIETAKDITVVRLTKHDGQFQAHLVASEVLRIAINRPSIRASDVFDGLFSDGVVIVEGDSGRIVYQTALQSVEKDFHFDTQFLSVEGHGGVVGAAEFYKTLNIPCVAIVDLDVIMRPRDEIEKILNSLNVFGSPTVLLEQIEDLCSRIREIPPCVTEDEAAAELHSLTKDGLSWTGDGDFEFVRKLRKLANRADRTKRIKRGIEEFERDHPQIAEDLRQVVASCKEIGLFLVPVGVSSQPLAAA